jgi:hypothetical protein
MSVAFSPDGRSVACRDYNYKQKAFDVSSGAALPGAPRWSLAWRLSELEVEVAHMPELPQWLGFIDLLLLLPS